MSRRFGIELELVPNLSADSLVRAVERAGQAARRQRTSSYWQLKTDSSVTHGRYTDCGWELTSPILSGEEGIDKVREVLNQINRSFIYLRGKYQILDDSCGLHVHVEVSDLSPEELALLIVIYGKAEDVLYRLVSPHRRTKHHCVPISLRVDEFWCDVQDATTRRAVETITERFTDSDPFMERYSGMNLSCYAGRGDVEFRMHEGHTDPDVVISWIRLLIALVEQAKKPLKEELALKRWDLSHVESLLDWGTVSDSGCIAEACETLRRRFRDMRIGV